LTRPAGSSSTAGGPHGGQDRDSLKDDDGELVPQGR
jgi:hypothetical protein